MLELQNRKLVPCNKKFIGLYLANAKHLFDQVLEEYGHISSSCLIKASKASLMCFLSFGNAIAVRSHRPDLLICLLDMHQHLATLIPSVEAFFPEDIGSSIRTEFSSLLTWLEHSTKVILKEFWSRIGSVSPTSPLPNGGVHPLTKYVINYILCFADNDYTLNLLLEEKDGEDLNEWPNADLEQSVSGPVAAYLLSITSVLEANIENKSNLYKDGSLKHTFMTNNIHYMVEKIKNSKIKTYFADEWIKSHIKKLQFHARSYQRNTWSAILPSVHCGRGTSRATLNARCRDFTLAFENVYKNQTRFCVPNLHIREELRISASINVVHAYRLFFSIVANSIGDKRMKYTAHDLEIYILDLLEGASKSLNRSWKGQKT